MIKGKIRVEVIRTFVLNGTIDGHDPIGVTYRITGGPNGPFRVTVISVNWGRGYAPGEFHRNVMNVLEEVEEREYVILLIQELDEADKAPEKKIFRKEMEPGTTLVHFETREPIAVSPHVPVLRDRKRMIMDQGTEIGAPEGTGPRRFIVTCIAVIEGVKIGAWCEHPHRYSLKNKAVQDALREGEEITKEEVGELVALCHVVFGGGDLNTTKYGKTHPKEKIDKQKHFDSIRSIVA